MDVKLVQFSIVVVGKDHNPSLINPDFLERQGIVEPKWGWKRVTDPITTPPFATVSYDSSVTITVEPNKLQVVDATGVNPSESQIAEIVSSYIRELPHIPYQAIGINFRGAITMADPGKFLKEHFFKNGKWDTPQRPLGSVGLKLVYAIEGVRAVLSIDEAHKAGDKFEEALLVNVNFHRDCIKAKPANIQIAKFLQSIKADWDCYLGMVSDALDND